MPPGSAGVPPAQSPAQPRPSAPLGSTGKDGGCPLFPLLVSFFVALHGPLSSLFQPLKVPSRTPFPTFGGSLLSLLQPLRGPSWITLFRFLLFVDPLRGYLFLSFADNAQVFQASPAPALPGGSYESETGFVSGTRTDGPPSTTTGAKMLLHFCPVGVTLSWEEAHPGARASRPHKSWHSCSHLLHRNQPAAAPCLCFGRAHAVPAGRAVGCNIAGKLSGNPRDSMRAGRPRSRVGRPDGEVGGIRRATSLKAGLSPLGNSRLPASRAPAPHDRADHSRVKQVLFQVSRAPALVCGSYKSETIRNRPSLRDLGIPSRLTSTP